MIDAYDACLKCSICELHCPVLRVSPRFPGPKNGGPGAARLRAAALPVTEAGLDLCLGCRTCDVVCPSGLHPAALVNQARINRVRRRGLSLRDWLLTRSELLGRAGTALPRLTNAALASRPVRWAMDRTLGLDRRRPLPRYPRSTFRSWFSRRPDPWRDRPAPRGTVAYFHGCSTNYMLPEIGRQTVAVLEHNGYRVVLPQQRCCGLPLIGNGDPDTARAWARHNIAQLLPYAEQNIPIVFTSTSCSLAVKQEYADVPGLPGAAAVAAAAYDIFEFLLACHARGELRTDFRPLAQNLPYHQPCHQRAQAIGTPALTLLRLIPGVNAWNLDTGCCGASGTHGFKREKYDLAMAVGAPLAEAIRSSAAPRALSDCEACRWQIEHATGIPAVHPVTVFWEAYGLD